jgi:hypothetical protein
LVRAILAAPKSAELECAATCEEVRSPGFSDLEKWDAEASAPLGR